MPHRPTTRRQFLKTIGTASVAAMMPNIVIPKQKRKLGVALAGLGNYGSILASALQETEYCELRGIVTGSPNKIPQWKRKYNIPDRNIYNYDNLHEVANNPEIDVIYIVLPNSMHKRYSLIAAEAGKHVWCEKPMALNAAECRAIITACEKNNVKLSIGYRMQHEPNTQTIMQFGREKAYGAIRMVEAAAGYYYRHSTNDWKLKEEMGGGAMYDMGVYPLNAARYCTHEEPIAVTARHETTEPDRFSEVDETTIYELEFPNGATAKCATSLTQGMNRLHVDCREGWYRLEPFQSYSGIRGKTSDGRRLNQSIPSQQARQMDDDALAILNNKPMMVPGEEGLKDIRVVEAIFEAAERGDKVEIGR